jgi:tripeptide aminopeptidase
MVSDFKAEVERYGAHCEVATGSLYPGFQLSEENPVVMLAARAAEDMGVKPRMVKSGGGSDANVFNHRGLPTANLGIAMRGAHTSDESLSIEDLAATTAWVLRIVMKAGKPE